MIPCPCKECLILPICRHKREIFCSLIYKWYVIDNYGVDDSLGELNKYLLKWGRLVKNKEQGCIR